MKRFFNDKNDLVTEALDGFLLTTPGQDLARLDGYPAIKVILRAAPDKTRVALVSGGGSGHEPAHAGFVGAGMLSAAVAGEVFASPSVEAVLAGILAVTGQPGCLLIVKNYTGDRLNFGLAAERAKAMGHRVEMVLVADDVALPDAHQPRGLAGTLFVHKIAGAMAETGASLEDVARMARAVALDCRSIGLALDTCTVPGNAAQKYLGMQEAELGLGIHGEPGARVISLDTAGALMVQVCTALEKTLDLSQPQAVILNNLGTVPPLEMSILAHAFAATSLGRACKLVIGPAPLMTSLDMNGFSVSALPLDAARSAFLGAMTSAPAWPGLCELGGLRVVDMPKISETRRPAASANPKVLAKIRAVCTALINNEAALNTLDARIGDGDTGSTVAGAARHIHKAAESLPLGNPADLCTCLSDILARQMGGSSGVLLAIFFAATGEALAKGGTMPAALQDGAGRVMEYGGAKPGDRTMLDALLPAIAELAGKGGMAGAAVAARNGARSTALMQTSLAGRSSYVPKENLKDVTDPGAEAMALSFEALAPGQSATNQ